MEIRKTFKYEAAHIVRGAWSQRCAQNVHGHSYLVEVFFAQKAPLRLDHAGNGGMIIDFGLIKKYGNDFIDSFDHSLFIWDVPKDADLIKFAKKNFQRVIVTPFPTSAEVQAAMFYKYFASLLHVMRDKMHCSDRVYVSRVIVHETTTGKAEFNADDATRSLVPINLADIFFSKGITDDWKEKETTKLIIGGRKNVKN